MAAWSLYQRHIFLTAKAMTGLLHPENFEEPERNVLEQERYIVSNQRLPYLHEKYWPTVKNNKVYMAKLSFNNGSSGGSIATVADNLSAFSPKFQPQIHQLASQLLQFRIDPKCWAVRWREVSLIRKNVP